jgi:2-amino-4-hydroxy-6-hydroxymethyldihydropteridine diphosphokinase
VITYLSLGTNLGNRQDNLQKALGMLASFVKIIRLSSIHETKPLYVTNQPDFLNLVAEGETNLLPADLLKKIKEVEIALGREETFRFGPRIIDIDILFYGNLVIQLDNLKIPHPLLHEREFVLKPLMELIPERICPIRGKSILNLYQELAA